MKTLSLTKSDIYKGSLILVSPDHPVRNNVDEIELSNLSDINPEVSLESETAAIFQSALEALNLQGEITVISGFRSDDEQKSIYSDSLLENGLDFTSKYVAIPGHSEHQTGMAIDMALVTPDINFLTPYFPYEGVCQKFRENISSYGFIERYPLGKEHITQIGHEPWHFRYVGTPHADIMNENNLTLEEYIDMLREYAYDKTPLRFDKFGTSYEIGFIDLKADTFEISISERHHAISGNNVDGLILTKW